MRLLRAVGLVLASAAVATGLSGEDVQDLWAPRRLAVLPESELGLAWLARVAVAPDGRAVAAWLEPRSRPEPQFLGRSFDPLLHPVGTAFSVSMTGSRCWGRIAAASLGGGRFVVLVTCNSGEQDGEDAVIGRIFDAGGAPRGEPFRVNSEVLFWRGRPDVAVAACGGERFVVVWESNDESSGWGVSGRIYSRSGRPLTEPFPVAEEGGSDRFQPDVACDDSGRFVAVWTSGRDGQEVFARRFDTEGNPEGPALRVAGIARSPAVELLPGGGFAVAWGGGDQVFLRRFDAAGRGGGDNVRLSAEGTHHIDRGPSLAAGPGGQLLAVWASTAAYRGTGRFVDAVRGLPLEAEFPLDETGMAQLPEVASRVDGGYLASWVTDAEGDRGARAIWARQVPAPAPASHPLTPEEVACEAERLEKELERLAPQASREPKGLALFSGPGNALEGTVYAAEPPPPGRAASGRPARPRWDLRRIRAFSLDSHGKITLAATETQQDLRVERLPARAEEDRRRDDPLPACHSWTTERDRSRADEIARQVRPRGPAPAFALAVYRGEGVDTFRLDLYPRREDGTPLGRIAAEMRVLCDRQGQPVEIRARRLEERTSLGQAGAERAGGSFGLGWLMPDAPRPLAEEPATLWAAGGDRELRIDLQSAEGSGIAEVCGR
jgi:hypothetical protein